MIIAIIITGSLVFIVLSILGNSIEKIYNSEKRLKQVYESTLQGWARALELRDHETEGHSRRVTQIAVALAQKVDVPKEELKFIRWGALLHDVGKMSVPDSILLKPDKLSNEEFETIKEHPEIAKKLLEEIPYLENALSIPYFHHERWDGSGYPSGLKGEEIPLPARIFSVIDVWDALLSARPYKQAWSREDTLNYLDQNAGVLFDPAIVKAFFELADEGLL